MTRRNSLFALAALLAALLPAAVAAAQGLDARYSFDDLQKMVADAQIVVRAKAGEPVAIPDAPKGLDYQIDCAIVEVLKGELAGKSLNLRLGSTITELGITRRAVAGKEFILALVPVEGLAGSYRLTRAGFEVASPEADVVLQIISGKVERRVVSPLRLIVDPQSSPTEIGKPALITIRLENPSTERAVYEQAPIDIRDNTVYLPGTGFIRVVDSAGTEVPPRETLKSGQNPPDAKPATIAPEGAFRAEIDLAQHFDLSRSGLYAVSVGVTTPGGELLRSTAPLQMVAAGLAAPNTPRNAGSLASELIVPSPEVYEAGPPVNGLKMLIRPTKAEFDVGEPIKVEVRLTNVDERKLPMHIDMRLERSLIVEVKPQGDSPAVQTSSQYITWSDKAPEGYTPYAYLRPGSFWGETINVNSLYGVDLAERLMNRVDPEKLQPNQINFDRYGMTLHSFDKPGVYRLDATYVVQPRPGDMRVWAGKLMSNHVFIRVKPGSVLGSAPR